MIFENGLGKALPIHLLSGLPFGLPRDPEGRRRRSRGIGTAAGKLAEPSAMLLIPPRSVPRAVTGVIISSVLWGISGLAAQELFRKYAVSVVWLTSARVVGSAILLAGWTLGRASAVNLRSLANWSDLGRLALYGVIALDGVQLTFFLAVKDGSAVSATLLQFTSPFFIMGWIVARKHRMPSPWLVLVAAIALAGIALVVTGGNLSAFSVAPLALMWGMVCAAFTAFYNVSPSLIFVGYDRSAVVAGAFVVGGLLLFPWLYFAWPHGMDLREAILALFVIVGGTAVPFLIYIISLRDLEPLVANLIGTLEPLTAAVGSVLFLGMVPTPALVAGGVLVLASVLFMSGSALRDSP